MRKIHEVLWLQFEHGRSKQEIARIIDVSPSTAADYVDRALLGASNYTYIGATWSQQLPDWVGSHVNSLAFLGGCTELWTPDKPAQRYVDGLALRGRRQPQLPRPGRALRRGRAAGVHPSA